MARHVLDERLRLPLRGDVLVRGDHVSHAAELVEQRGHGLQNDVDLSGLATIDDLSAPGPAGAY